MRAVVSRVAWARVTVEGPDGDEVVGAVDGWYPYPFLDPDEDGWLGVLVTAVGITALFVAFYVVGRLVDRRTKETP